MTKPTLSKPEKSVRPARFALAMHNLAYICVGLSIILAVTQFWLYGLRYRSVYSTNAWSSVTLANGQSYFGHLEQYGPNTVVLFNAYYLQSAPAATTDANTAATDDADVAADDTTAAEPGLQLVSLSNDLHKPYDYLIINKDQILFWQHLTSESPIVQTIENAAQDAQ